MRGEFRRAGLNPRVWLARRVNQSATDGMGGVVIFRVKRRGPLPAGCRRPFAGSADPLFHGPPLSTAADPPPSFRRRGGADPSLLRTLPTIPSSSARTPSLRRRGPPLSVDADPLSPSARTPSLPRTHSFHCRGALSDGADPLFLLRRGPLPTIPLSGRRGPPLSIGADPLSPAARSPSGHRRGPPLSGGADPLSPSTRTPSLHRRGPLSPPSIDGQ
ncbi:hypothetical protein niasHT_008442 [Heterodera trifolii]|uniref:Uncharacterized protein n=1 Tax=Heterodera trifolii TaxID=157864 RepID=A0ABD2M3E9_9BILA